MLTASLQTLLLVAGPPGVGKTTLATGIARSLAWPLLDKDTIKSCLLTLAAPEEIAGPASYELLLEIGRDLLGQGLSVIFDCPAHHESFLLRCATLARESDATFQIALCLLDTAERERRMSRRVSRPSQWLTIDSGRETDLEEWKSFFPAYANVIWMDKEPEALVDQALAHLALPVGPYR